MNRILTCMITALLVLTGIADAQTPLRQSTSRVVRICGAVDQSDGITPVTTLALGSADEAEALRDNTATLDISGATFSAVTGSDGCYSLTLDTTATNTVGELVVVIQDDSLILPIKRTFQVYEEEVFDTFYAASAEGPPTVTEFEARTIVAANYFDPTTDPVNVGEIETIDATTYFEGRTLAAADYFDPALDAVANVTNVAEASVDEFQVSAIADLFNTNSGTTYGSAVAGSAVLEIADNAGGSSLTAAAIVDEWESQSQADPTGFHVNAKEWNDAPITTALQDAADVYAEFTSGTNEDAFKADVAAALSAIYLDQLLANAYDSAAPSGDPAALLNEMTENDAGETRFTVNALEQGPSGTGSSPAAIYAEFTSGTNEDVFKADVSGLATAASVAALNDPTANEVRDAIMTYVLETGITFEQAQCYMLSVLAGESAFTAGSPDQTIFSDPNGTNVRVTVDYGTDDGDRTNVTLATLNCGSN